MAPARLRADHAHRARPPTPAASRWLIAASLAREDREHTTTRARAGAACQAIASIRRLFLPLRLLTDPRGTPTSSMSSGTSFVTTRSRARHGTRSHFDRRAEQRVGADDASSPISVRCLRTPSYFKVIVPAPMFTRSPTRASPMYEKVMHLRALAEARVLHLAIVPHLDASRGTRRAGVRILPDAHVVLERRALQDRPLHAARSPICVSRTMAYGPMREFAPIRVAVLRIEPRSIDRVGRDL